MRPWFFNIYMDAMINEVKMRMGRRGESGNYLATCMQMTWFCVVSQRMTSGKWQDGLLKCVENVWKSIKVRAR